jgi:putative DNA primase/helicase
MEAMRCVFGDYGFTAPAAAFRSKVKDQAATNDLHGLRGKRFVTTSETAESTSFDEDLLKRLSGRDQVISRELYQANQEWTPECTLWLATNNAPRFTSDDDAIWRRTKLIPFLTTFTGAGELPDFARRVLMAERDGILNWLLVGLKEFRMYGLEEPVSVQRMASEQRMEGDSVARFMDERSVDGILIFGTDKEIRSGDLYQMYLEWSRQSGERPIGRRRFTNRVGSNFPDLENARIGGHQFWVGVGRSPNAGIVGLIPPLWYQDS